MQFWDSVFSWIGDSLSENWRGLVTHGVGYCIGIIGVILAIFCRKSYRICFQKSCTKLIDGALPAAVKITVDGKVARRLSATKIVVWNGGYRALKSDQVPDPITMSFGEGDRIYRHCLFVTKESNRVRVERDGDHVLRMKFSNLDRHDGIALDILHDSEIEYPSLNGTILEHKGFKDCGEIMFTPDRTKLLPKLAVTISLLVIPGIVILITAGFRSNGPGFVVFGLLYVFLIFWSNRQRIPKPLIRYIRP